MFFCFFFTTVPPVIVDIVLLNEGSDAAGLSTDPTQHLTTDQNVKQYVVIVIHGKTYRFQVRTGAIDPKAEFDWIRTDDVNDANSGMVVRDGTRPPQTIACSPEVDMDLYTIENLDYDDWRDQKLRVNAANEFSLGAGPAWEHVVLDVQGNYTTVNVLNDVWYVILLILWRPILQKINPS